MLECSGSAVARRQATQVAHRAATVVYVGGGPEPDIAFSSGDIIAKDLTIRGNSVFTIASYYAAIDFLRSHSVPLEGIITHRFKIAEAVEAFALFDSGETGKVVFAWDE